LWPRVRTLPGARETIAQHIDLAESSQISEHRQGRLAARLTLWLLCY
jgi:hypothetical protein